MKNYVILDIDRTIINGTSWYHACACPDLLINQRDIDTFISLNKRLYNNGSLEEKREFRVRTFELINKTVSDSTYNLLKECGCSDGISKGQFISKRFFECVGSYTLKKLVTTDDVCKKIIKLISRYYFGNIELIFLTSGYEPYMKGLVTTYMGEFDEKYKWRVVGSTFEINNGEIKLLDEITQKRKVQHVRNLIANGDRVVFLADDSTEEKELFDIVSDNGGYSFNVKYDKASHKLNWDELLECINNQDCLLEYLMNKSEVSLAKNDFLSDNYFYKHMGEIGIMQLDEAEYMQLLKYMADDKRILDYINMVVHKKGEKYYLRGRYYYYWLPSYITGRIETKYEGWKNVLIDGIDTLEYICEKYEKTNIFVNLLIYIICDHLLSVLYLALYCMEKRVIDDNENIMKSYIYVENSVCMLNHIIYSVFEGNLDFFCLRDVLKELKMISIEEMNIIENNEKYLLELNDYKTIHETVLNILNTLKDKAKRIDKVIYFSYGGISLGYAFKTIIKQKLNITIELIPSHYSSKRGNDKVDFIEKIPFFKRKSIVQNDDAITFLIDNNVTTFLTMSQAKKCLKNKGLNVICAVAEVDYKNIYRWLLKKGEYEEMASDWYKILDIKPVTKYISAYNTWGTSETSAVLERIYSQDAILGNSSDLYPRKIHSEHRKICRVHNIYDLKLAMRMGATMIGIHAVISHKEKYYKSEHVLDGKVRFYPNLPVADYEVESIKYMVQCIPSNVMPILVIENKLLCDDIMTILGLYGLKPNSCGIQMQFYADKTYIDSVMSLGFERIIVTVGIMQKNVSNYLKEMDKILRTSKDFLLVDMSKHQPNIIAGELCGEEYDMDFEEKYSRLSILSTALKELKTSILLADDIMPDKMILCQLMLLSRGVNVVGLDMQNNIETCKEEQGYCKIREPQSSNCHYAKIRKSADKIKKWDDFEKYDNVITHNGA